MKPIRHITLPSGFIASATSCGLKQNGSEDIAIIAAKKDASTAIVTTQNQIVGAPITWCRQILPKGRGKIRAIVINSGCSNVCNGKVGLRDAQTMARLTAEALATDQEKILVASTGVIGQRLDMGKVRSGIKTAAQNMGVDSDAAVLAGIMTTDLKPKSAVRTFMIGKKKITLAGIVKGSGMIAPSMATMIAVITTDVDITPPALHKALTHATGETFNAITVDSDTSTSDTVAVLASGDAKNKTITATSASFAKFSKALKELCLDLARSVIDDGEGATKVIEIRIRGARDDKDARLAAKAVANSPLVKTAAHGEDPNWGRIAMALGKSDAKIIAEKLSIRIGGVCLFSKGMGKKFDIEKVIKHLAGNTIIIDCNLGQGGGKFTALTCDLSREYITINADYHT